MFFLADIAARIALLAQEGPQLPINRLDPLTRTMVVMVLLGLVLLGIGAIVCIRLGGRWVRRVGRSDRAGGASRADRPALPSDWESRP